MRVLYVEDSEINRRVVGAMLLAGQMEMAEAEDGQKGLEMIDAHDYDLVLMDLRMPVMDGITAIRRLRARHDAKARLPVIVVTADSNPTVDADCHAAGADQVLPKPVSMVSLFGAINNLMAVRGET